MAYYRTSNIFGTSVTGIFGIYRLAILFFFSGVLTLTASDFLELKQAVKNRKYNAVELVQQAYQQADSANEHFDCITLLNLKMYALYGNYGRTDILDILKETNKHISNLKNSEEKGEAYYLIGDALFGIREYDLAQIHLVKSVEIYRLSKGDAGLRKVYLTLSEVHFERSDLDRSLDFALKAKEMLLDVQRDENNYSAIYNQIGKIYLALKKPDIAKSYLRESFEYAISKNDSSLLSDAYYFQASLNLKLEKLKKAEKFLKKAIQIQKGLKEYFSLGNSFFLYADIHQKLGDSEKAIFDIERAFQYFSNVNDEHMKVRALIKMAEIQMASGQFNKATNSLNLALNDLEGFSSGMEELLIRSKLKDIYRHYGKNGKAIEQLERYVEIIDSMYVAQQLNTISDVQASYDLQKTEFDKLYYKKQWQFSQSRNTMIVIIALLVLVLLILVYLNIRKSKLLLKKEYTLMEAKKDLAQNELDQALSDLEMNKQNLQNLTQNIIKKNTQIQDLGLELEKVKGSGEGDEKIDQLNELIQFRILTSEDWDEFKKLFNMVYKGFFVKLKNEHPSLTKSEIKLFMVSKLNLSINDTAGLLAISPESVRKARYRLKKKLNLEEEDLSDYILDF